MALKVFKHLNTIEAIKSFTNINCNLCMYKCLIIPKKLCDKSFTLVKNLKYMGHASKKRLSIDFFYVLMGPILGERVRLYNKFKGFIFKNANGHFEY